jgi:hypothetical protein
MNRYQKLVIDLKPLSAKTVGAATREGKRLAIPLAERGRVGVFLSGGTCSSTAFHYGNSLVPPGQLRRQPSLWRCGEGAVPGADVRGRLVQAEHLGAARHAR